MSGLDLPRGPHHACASRRPPSTEAVQHLATMLNAWGSSELSWICRLTDPLRSGECCGCDCEPPRSSILVVVLPIAPRPHPQAIAASWYWLRVQPDEAANVVIVPDGCTSCQETPAGAQELSHFRCSQMTSPEDEGTRKSRIHHDHCRQREKGIHLC